MQKPLDSFIRKRLPPKSYEEETVDHRNNNEVTEQVQFQTLQKTTRSAMKKSENKKEELFARNGKRYLPGCSSMSLHKQCLPHSQTRAVPFSQVLRLSISET